MFNKYDDKILVPIPQEVLNRLDKKTKKALEDAVSDMRNMELVNTPSYVREMGHHHQQTHQTGLLVPVDVDDYQSISRFTKMSLRRADAEARAAELEDQSKELAELKNSLKHIKKAFN